MPFLLLLISLFSQSNPKHPSPEKPNLKVDVQNVRVQKGAVHIGLYRACADFPNCEPVELIIIDAKGKPIQAAFSVDPGEYAVAVYHDENGNGKMDKRVFGIPKEPYGFSNDFRPTLSAPKFSDCRFKVGNEGKTIRVKLN
ncbi:MAG: DUF2141 domain-containing protein [Spirosoma sp.]|nr:DUF2141 domain-containing protein [Spirosoma sp.]